MLKRFFVVFACCLLPVARCLPSEARDLILGPMVLSLSDKWTVNEEPGPELLKASLAANPTATLSIWKYRPGNMPAAQFLDSLRADLGWTSIDIQTIADSRFGRTSVGLYRKSGAYEELPFKIRSYDFVLDGDIYVLEMRVPQSHFDKSDPDFRAVFAALSNLSGAPSRAGSASPTPQVPMPPTSAVEPVSNEELRTPEEVTVVNPPISSQPSTSFSSPPPATPPTNTYTFIYQLPDGGRIGFDMGKTLATILAAGGEIKSVFPISGTPLLSPEGVFLLTDEYAYRVDPSNGNISARMPAHEVMGRAGKSAAGASVSPGADLPVMPKLPAREPAKEPAPDSRPQPSAPAGTWGRGAADPAGVGGAGTWGRGAADPAGDLLKSAISRGEEIRKTKGLKPAIDYLMGQKPSAEKSQSPYLYEFYFRLGEYWEETGDLETALAYYRLATKAID